MPFLVDSIGIVFSQMNIAVHLIVHPVLAVRRDARGNCSRSVGADRRRSASRVLADDGDRPAARRRAGARARTPRSRVARRRAHARSRDFPAMLERVARWPTNSSARTLPVPKSHASEARALLAWMHDGHFVFLGYRYYRLKRGRSRDALVRDDDSGLGILRGPPKAHANRRAHRAHGAPAPPGARARAAGAHQGQHAVDRASRQLSRLRRRQDLRRRRPGHPASIASSACGLRAPITSRPRRFRCCGASSTR